VATAVDWSHFDRSLSSAPYSGIVHEARHADGSPHTCTDNKGRYTKDKSIAEMGAFGVVYYLNEWLANHSDEEREFRMNAATRAAMLRQSGGAFCCECSAKSSTASLAVSPSLFRQPDSAE